MTTLKFAIPNSSWLSSNQRLHWAAKAKRVAVLRELAMWRGLEIGFKGTHRKQVRITAHIGYATNGRADPANSHPTVKALVDGLVDAGLFVDDSHEWVIGPDYRRDETKSPRGFHTVRLEIEEANNALVQS
jgi:hypothetical protein